ncbi:DUF4241 domain-containing protein [Streptomyces sp. NPDC048281]|uniref:DUF4241 domain-containing protein n=1 Tax=Streptomyces sp. NPDC048281 TaxID=3154715 RepID=UPI0034202DBD
MPIEPRDFDTLYAAGTRYAEPGNGYRILLQEDRGWLSLPTGRVVAAEPAVLGADTDRYAFAQTVPPGRYPVVLTIAEYRQSPAPDADVVDERVAAARLVIRDEPVTGWEMALPPGRHAEALGDDEFYGYPVDGGTGCFVDPGSTPLLDDDEEMRDLSMDIADRPTSVTVLEGPDGEPILAAFTTGWGDGSYPTWVGRSASGEIACFLTDFGILEV